MTKNTRNINEIRNLLAQCDAVIATAGNGLAKMEGLDMLDQPSFKAEFPELAANLGANSIAQALDKKCATWTEQWQFWSTLIDRFSLHYQPSQGMMELKELLAGKDYFVATSTFGHFFESAGFNENRIFNIFGDWTRMQCSSGINHGQVSAVETIKTFAQAAECGEDLVPKCSVCGQPMELHMPLNANFFPDTDANAHLRWFLTANEDKKVVILEAGVDETSPQLLKPMLNLVQQFPRWSYVGLDLTNAGIPDEIAERTFFLGTELAAGLHELVRN